MNLSTVQQRAIDNGEAVEITLNGKRCAILRWDVYQRVRTTAYDDSPWTEDEMMLLAAEAAEDLDNMDEIKP